VAAVDLLLQVVRPVDQPEENSVDWTDADGVPRRETREVCLDRPELFSHRDELVAIAL
jgi:hypothetical protein